MGSSEESVRLKTALGWLESHQKRLAVERRSTEERLRELTERIARLESEIEGAKSRIRHAGRHRPEADDAGP